MQASTDILTIEFGASTIQAPSVATVNIERTDGNVLVLSDSNDDVCYVVDLYNTSYFLCRTRTPTFILVYVDINKIPYSLLYIRMACHESPSQCPPFHHSSSLGLSLYASKLRKYRRRLNPIFLQMNF